MTIKNIKAIAFDADDTLWINETNYQEAEHQFCELLKDYQTINKISQELLISEQQTIAVYGYGAKGFTLSMIETAIKISNKKVNAEAIQKIIAIGKELMEKPVELLDDIVTVLSNLKGKYKIILATKGDLLDQQRKLRKSGLFNFFDHIEIMSEKHELDYKNLLNKINVAPENFLMVGNSLKSDVIPVVDIGSRAVHIPFHVTWAHETVNNYESDKYFKIKKLIELLKLLPEND